MQWIPCSMIACSGFYAVWPKASRWNAVDSMQRNWMQCTPDSLEKRIPIECSVLHAAGLNAVYSMQREEIEPNWIQGFMQHYWMQWIQKARLNAVDFMQHGPKHPDGMQWIPCSVIECRGFHAFWHNGSILYAVEFMQRGPMHPDSMQWIVCSMAQSIPIECSGFHAFWLNAVYPCSVGTCIPIECSGFHAAWLSAVDSIQLSKMNPD